MNSLPWIATTFLLAVPATDVTGETPSWVGKIVVLKELGATLQSIEQGKEHSLEKLDELSYQVLSDQGERIQLKTRIGTVGWLRKNAVVTLEDAGAYFTRRIEANPKDGAAYGSRGWVWHLKEESQSALKDFDEAVRLQPCAVLYTHRGRVYHACKQYAHAVDACTDALERDPAFVLAHYHRGLAQEARHNYNRAVEDYDQAIRCHGNDAQAYQARARCWYLLGEYEKAIADYSEALRFDPDNADSYQGRGWVWYRSKQDDNALGDFDAALRCNPKILHGHYARGCVHERRKHYEKAIKEYTEEIRVHPGKLLGYWGRASAYGYLKDHEKALADYNEALRLEPKHATLCNVVAWLQATSGNEKVRDGKRALELAKFAAVERKNEVSLLNTLAAAHAAVGDFDEAVRWQEKAMEEQSFGDNISYRGLDPLSLSNEGCQERLELYRSKQAYRQN